MRLSFVCPVADTDLARVNILASEAIRSRRQEVVLMKGHTNVSKALNDGMKKACRGLIVAIHHDMYLPPAWEDDLLAALQEVEAVDPDWAALGIAGVRLEPQGEQEPQDGPGHRGQRVPHGYVNHGGHVWGRHERPTVVDTLDEALVVLKPGEFEFDEAIPHSPHMYAVELSLQARAQNRKVYAISAYCYHNSPFGGDKLPREFFECKRYVREKWRDLLPVATTCTTLLEDDEEDERTDDHLR